MQRQRLFFFLQITELKPKLFQLQKKLLTEQQKFKKRWREN